MVAATVIGFWAASNELELEVGDDMADEDSDDDDEDANGEVFIDEELFP